MEPLVVICPQVEENSRLSAVLAHALEGRPHMKLQRPDQLHPMEGRRVLFAISLLHGGVNLGWYAMLSAIRQDKRFFEGCCGAVLVDGDGELYTKSAAREIVFAANQAGCAFRPPARWRISTSGPCCGTRIILPPTPPALVNWWNACWRTRRRCDSIPT